MTTIGAWELNTVQHCDALELLAGLPDACVDLIVTSPPYDNLRTYNGYTFDFEAIARDTFRVLKQGGVLVWVVGDATVNGSETLTSFRQALFFRDVCGFRMHDTMIWEKQARYPDTKRYYQSFEFMFVFAKGEPNTFNPLTQSNRQFGRKVNGTERKADGRTVINPCFGNDIKREGVMPNVWFIDSGFMRTTKDVEAFEHPAMFPEALAERHILTWSNAGDLVLDYFGGSGTTAKMARNNGRNFLTCDISAEYCELMRRRLDAPYTLPMFVEG